MADASRPLRAPIEARELQPGRWAVGYHSMGGFHRVTQQSFATCEEAKAWMRNPSEPVPA